MTYTLRFLPDVEEDVIVGYAWYGAKAPGLGEECLRMFYACTSEILRNPPLYPKVYREFRRRLLRRFPYTIYFRIESNEIILYLGSSIVRVIPALLASNCRTEMSQRAPNKALHLTGTFMNFTPGARLEIIEPYTICFPFPEPAGGALTNFAPCIWPIGSSIVNSAGGRRAGESLTELARGARARIIWWKESPRRINGQTNSSWKPIWTIGTQRGFRTCNGSSLPTLWSKKKPLNWLKPVRAAWIWSGVSPLETLRMAQSPFAKVVKARGSLGMVSSMFNMRKTGSLRQDVRLRQTVNYAINREDLICYAARGPT